MNGLLILCLYQSYFRLSSDSQVDSPFAEHQRLVDSDYELFHLTLNNKQTALKNLFRLLKGNNSVYIL